MEEKVIKCGIKKEKGYRYFVDDRGDISRSKVNGALEEKASKRTIRNI